VKNDKNKEKENVWQESDDFSAADDQIKAKVQQQMSEKAGFQNQDILNIEEKMQKFTNNGISISIFRIVSIFIFTTCSTIFITPLRPWIVISTLTDGNYIFLI
jgi:Flp pilus assembly protein TadB